MMLKSLLGICFLAISTMSFAEPQTWYFVRHFEKQLGDNPSLTKKGKARAEALAAFFSDKPLNQVYSTDYNRTLETSASVAALKSIDIQSYDPRDLVVFATQIKTLNHVLVVGHSNTTPELLRLMGGKGINIEESDYGVVYVLQKHGFEMTTQNIHIPLK
ncbi:MAG: phosphohistidine phosphatase SixA [Flavobacteriales bacterium]|jgi:broad specificity phosphatase PhoE